MSIEIGQSFPAFALPNQDGKIVNLADFAGKWLVVYFYPKDDTAGCTIQGKGFTASKQDYEAANIEVVGVSQDDIDSHKGFCNKFGFTIDLLSDTDHKLINAVGLGQVEYSGVKYWSRTSYVVDPEGNLRKIYENVKPQGHELELLENIKQLQVLT
ncbi:MAG: peroxiredoxin [Chloroflexi bacterium]|uniref:thioredoxin-dependent peroxiredoxin n=1 Tax=Candidatus Chlorohelix allophototropha TaxID=3003348 RepID=A0A8T7M7X4_9CHLR|nr:peroxiredoxin [Chloroflexota bacterium]WJW68173.1 peroxiredoxin [Chloroflexota bacterium L227-S17]